MYDTDYKINGEDLPLRFYFWNIKKRVKFKELDEVGERELVEMLRGLCKRMNAL